MLNNIIKNKWVYGLILALLLALGLLIVLSDSEENLGTELEVNQQTAAGQEEVPTSEETVPIESSESLEGYYLVKEDNGVIKVFHCNQNQETLWQETDIEYSLLSLEDQQLLKEGVKLKTEEELFSFLENFDS